MNERRLVRNFKSYIGLDDFPPKVDKEKEEPPEEVKLRLLAGEVLVASAQNVLLFAPVSEKQSGRFGTLFVTNYKLSFVTDDAAFGGCRQQNLLLGPYDVTMSMIGSVYELSGMDNEESGNKWRRRQLRPSHSINRKMQGLQIHCKNMRVLSFGFKFSTQEQSRKITTAILHHAFPKIHNLLFAYDCKEDYYPTVGDVNMFHMYNDWKREMERTHCQNWRISQANGTPDDFYFGAGKTLVVPANVLDYQLSGAARYFRKGRVPIWVWSGPDGAALIRSGESSNTNSHNGSSTGSTPHEPESVLLEAVRRAHPNHTTLKIISLVCPTLHNAFKKLINICTPNTLTNFWEQDSNFYSSFESTRWLRYVSECLSFAADSAKALSDNITVVLREDGMDYSAIVSSLTQLLIDPHFRTIRGFQSLIQKDWIALGHPFSDRLGHISLKDSDVSEGGRNMAPVFLLFLDCCWQLQKQFPTSFEFTDCYLTTLWDSAHNQLFDTFLFNTPRDRELAVSKCKSLRSVWDWKEQFVESEIQYFYNPLYSPPAQPLFRPKSLLPTSAIRLPGLASPPKSASVDFQWLKPGPAHLVPKTDVACLDIWQQCYFRWLPLLHIQGSGDIQYLLFNMRLTKEIHHLKQKISDAQYRSNGSQDEDFSLNDMCPHPSGVGTFFPFIGNTSGVTDPLASLTPSLLEPNQQLDSQSILNAPD